MSFKCPANYIEGDNMNIYNDLVNSYKMNVHLDEDYAIKDYTNNSSNLPSFLKSGILPSSLDPESTQYTVPELKAILKGLTRKITSCSTAYKSTESYTIISKLKSYFSGNNIADNLIKTLYLISYFIIAYLGYSYITNKMFGKSSIPTYFNGTNRILYYIFIVFIPITMISLMISNKVNVSFSASNVLIYLSIALIVLIGFIKTVASNNAWFFIPFISLILICSGLAGSGMYYWSGESAKVNDEGESRDNSSNWLFLMIVLIAILMLFSLKFSFIVSTIISVIFIIILIAITVGGSNSKTWASFNFLGILTPTLIVTIIKYIIYKKVGINNETAFIVATYVGLKVAILSGLFTLGFYEMYKANAEIEKAKNIETEVSESPYYSVTRPINGLMYVYKIILGLIISTILLVIIFHSSILFKLNGNISDIRSSWAFKGIDFSYVMAVIIIMSLVLSYNGTFAIWLPFILIPVGLLERGVATTVLNVISKNTSKEIENWQPVGSYLIELIIKLLTYTPLNNAQLESAGENRENLSLIDTISELNSTMFNVK